MNIRKKSFPASMASIQDATGQSSFHKMPLLHMCQPMHEAHSTALSARHHGQIVAGISEIVVKRHMHDQVLLHEPIARTNHGKLTKRIQENAGKEHVSRGKTTSSQAKNSILALRTLLLAPIHIMSRPRCLHVCFQIAGPAQRSQIFLSNPFKCPTCQGRPPVRVSSAHKRPNATSIRSGRLGAS